MNVLTLFAIYNKVEEDFYTECDDGAYMPKSIVVRGAIIVVSDGKV